jgi:hypothetical protein
MYSFKEAELFFRDQGREDVFYSLGNHLFHHLENEFAK